MSLNTFGFEAHTSDTRKSSPADMWEDAWQQLMHSRLMKAATLVNVLTSHIFVIVYKKGYLVSELSHLMLRKSKFRNTPFLARDTI